MRNLLRLGHLEELTTSRLRTVPPTIISQADNRHLVLGARTIAVREGLSRFPGLSVLPTVSQREGPAVWHVAGSDEAVAAGATALGLTVARDRGTDLLASLPCLADTLGGAPLEAIPDKTEKWNPDATFKQKRWLRTRADGHTPGVYRTLRKPHQWFFRPVEGASTIRLNAPELRVAAAWLLVRGKVRLVYSQGNCVLSVPANGFALPLLVDRGLILASGRLPEWGSRRANYFDIEHDRARHVARILGAPLEVTT